VKLFPLLPTLLLLLLFATISVSQARKGAKELPPSAFKLVTVQVSGTQRYKPEDVIHASSLQIGQTVHEDNLKDAARRLGESGAFTDVTYGFEYTPDGTKVELKVKDVKQFAPAKFENLVWFSDQELLEQLHARVPLFDGELPVTGPLPDDVVQALQAMLDDRKIPAQVDYVRLAHDDGSTEAFDFSASGPRVVVGSVEFAGADTTELPGLEAAGKSLRGGEYERSKLRHQEDGVFLPILLQHGYLKANFEDPAARITPSDQDEILVDVTFPLNPGPQYKLKAVVLAGNKAVPLDTLRQAIQVRSDQPADAVQLKKDVDSIRAIYGVRGYMDVAVETTPEFDDTQHTVVYRLSIREGDVFKMGELEILGVDGHTKDRLQSNWTLMSGDIYNSGYTRRFVSQALKEVLTTGEWSPDIQETVDRKDKTVDVTLRFIAR